MNHTTKAPIVLDVKNLKIVIESQGTLVKPVDDLNFVVRRGKTLAIVGESGCGKSLTALSLIRLLPPNIDIVEHSKIMLGDINLCTLSEKALWQIRGKKIGMIFQDPMLALNPVMSVGEQLKEVVIKTNRFNKKAEKYLAKHLANHPAKHNTYIASEENKGSSKNQKEKKNEKPLSIQDKIIKLLEQVRIPDPSRVVGEYPHQLSGGMKQRIMIAMALACEPDILIADEPTTALDVTTQAQVLSLMKELQVLHQTAIILITHDLGVVAQMADEVAVMYAGHFIEQKSATKFFKKPEHPYSQLLLKSLPEKTPRNQKLETINGSVPSLSTHFTQCRFLNRCPLALTACKEQLPRWISNKISNVTGCESIDGSVEKSNVENKVRCLRYDDSVINKELIVQNVNINAEALHSSNNIAKDLNINISEKTLLAKSYSVFYPIRKGILKRTIGYVKAVDEVSFNLHSGKTVCLVGESGCGKTTAGKALMQLIMGAKEDLSEIVYPHLSPMPHSKNKSLQSSSISSRKLSKSKLKAIRQHMQFIFQDPFSSMDPHLRILDILLEGMNAFKIGKNPSDRLLKIKQHLKEVGLDDSILGRYPHEFSGGQRQRICIARALCIEPKILILDEPTSALDVSVQAQVLNLLKELQDTQKLSYLFITHNIGVVSTMADEVLVMYLGKIVEAGTRDQILETPKHPYTKALLKSVPSVYQSLFKQTNILELDIDKGKLKLENNNKAVGMDSDSDILIKGEVPSPVNPPKGCHYAPRCNKAMPICLTHYPPKSETDQHLVRCFLYSHDLEKT